LPVATSYGSINPIFNLTPMYRLGYVLMNSIYGEEALDFRKAENILVI
jgi:hypothetical protein